MIDEKIEKIWQKTMKDYIKSYEAINHLYYTGILSNDEVLGVWMNLIEDIIRTFKREVEE